MPFYHFLIFFWLEFSVLILSHNLSGFLFIHACHYLTWKHENTLFDVKTWKYIWKIFICSCCLLFLCVYFSDVVVLCLVVVILVVLIGLCIITYVIFVILIIRLWVLLYNHFGFLSSWLSESIPLYRFSMKFFLFI